MKKKLFALLCVLTCIFGLTACGSKELTPEEVTIKEIQDNEAASIEAGAKELSKASIEVAQNNAILAKAGFNKEVMASKYCELVQEAVSDVVVSTPKLGAFDGLITTLTQMESDMGEITSINYDSASVSVQGKEIVVAITVNGKNCDGTITCKFSNDKFLRLHEGDAQANTTFAMKMAQAGSNMGKAGLNTLLGMGTVFVMLIVISLLISAFVLLQKKPKKEAAPAVVKTPAVAPAVEEELVDDTELVAVIMAAIKAYEGNGSTDGFVVRSIKKANRRM